MDQLGRIDIYLGYTESSYFYNFYLFTYLFLAVLDLHYCRGFSLIVVSGGYSLVALPRFLIIEASVIMLVHRL